MCVLNLLPNRKSYVISCGRLTGELKNSRPIFDSRTSGMFDADDDDDEEEENDDVYSRHAKNNYYYVRFTQHTPEGGQYFREDPQNALLNETEHFIHKIASGYCLVCAESSRAGHRDKFERRNRRKLNAR